MYEIDNQKFGAFVAMLRKEKGYTQKELAERLFLSDKAVSKWERGLNLPDIALLEPLAQILDVTVAELLKGERIHMALEAEEMDELLGKTIQLSDQTKKRRSRQWKFWYGVAVCGALLELGFLIWQKVDLIQTEILFTEGMFAFFGAWVCLFAKELLPVYYDENKLHFVTDGVFRVHIPFVRIHNGNWPGMLEVCRYYLTIWILIFPAICYLLIIAGVWELMRKGLLLFCVFGLLGCMVAVGKYYE